MRHKLFYSFLLLIWLSGLAAAQIPTVTGIGLAGSLTQLDTLVQNQDTVWVRLRMAPVTGFDVRNISLGPGQSDRIRVHAYLTPVPQDSQDAYWLSADVGLIPSSIQIGEDLARFAFELGSIVDPYFESFQIEVGIESWDTLGNIAYSPTVTSFIPVEETEAVNDSVDIQARRYLRYRDQLTNQPTLHYPVEGGSLGRIFNLDFFLPEPADSGRVYLLINNPSIIDPEQSRVVYFADTSAGDHSIRLDAWNLADSPEVSGVVGSDSLRDSTIYDFRIGYQDIHRNLQVFDTSAGVLTDFVAYPPIFTEPRQGSSSADSTILVHYFLPEEADSVFMVFRQSESSVFQDPLSPHVVLFEPAYNGYGNQAFFIDGREIGDDGVAIEWSNRGTHDRLVAQVLYDVSLVYWDVSGNLADTVENRNYLWPDDRITIPPEMIAPLNGSRDNASFWVQFRLPETPRLGTVRIIAVGQAGDPGSPHTIWFETIAGSGTYGFYLNALQLHLSEFATRVEGPGTPEQNNTFIDQFRYLIRVVYQDEDGNPEATSVARFSGFDNTTLPPTLFTPVTGDTFSYAGTEVRYSQLDRAIPGTLRLILRQTSGPEFDTGSPHVLYISNVDTSGAKSMTLLGTSLAASTGIDSIAGGASLVPRGVYELTLEYQDSLGNPPGQARVFDLLFPSGSTVFARGGVIGGGLVEPGVDASPVFELSLQTAGGQSALRGLHFSVEGTITPADLIATESKLWLSVDSVLSVGIDTPIAAPAAWLGGDLSFSGIAIALSEAETWFFVTLSFDELAESHHTVRLVLPGPQSVDCGGDPVLSSVWPIGSADAALPVMLTEFYTEQDPVFGALNILWLAESELNNDGFQLYRRADGAESFTPIASYAEHPGLVGRGTAATAKLYRYTDGGLTPGARYFYKLLAVSIGGDVTEYDSIASGVPRLPPGDFHLADAYPNPFNQSVTFEYVVPFSAEVILTVYNLEGRTVRELVRALQPPSLYRVRWDGADANGHALPSGVYFYRLQTSAAFDQAKKVLLLR